jgi:hypothetical protein
MTLHLNVYVATPNVRLGHEFHALQPFRGGTAINKLLLKQPLRYSEDIDEPDRRLRGGRAHEATSFNFAKVCGDSVN